MEHIILSNNDIPYKHNLTSCNDAKFTIKLNGFPEINFEINSVLGHDLIFNSDLSAFNIEYGNVDPYSGEINNKQNLEVNQSVLTYFTDGESEDWFGRQITYYRVWNNNDISILLLNEKQIYIKVSYCVNRYDNYGWTNFSDETWGCILKLNHSC